MHTSSSDFLTIPQAADFLNVSTRFIERAIQDREITVHRFGRSVRIKRGTLDTWADRATETAVGGRGNNKRGRR